MQRYLLIAPRQILIDIFSPFPVQLLLPLTLVCRRFHALAVRILHRRLLQASSLPDHDLILECYHPSAKISTPYFSCRYLGIGTLGQVDRDTEEVSLSDLSKLYSRLRPVVTEENRRPRSRYPRPSEASQAAGDVAEEPATVEVHLDESELFSQLCTVTNLVKVGPKRGLFLTLVNLSDGVIRVWRDWLAAAADRQHVGQQDDNDDGILWADASRTVGIRFAVKPSGTERMPLLVGPDEDPAVSYTLTYEGERSVLPRTGDCSVSCHGANSRFRTAYPC